MGRFDSHTPDSCVATEVSPRAPAASVDRRPESISICRVAEACSVMHSPNSAHAVSLL